MALRQIIFLREALQSRTLNTNHFVKQFRPQFKTLKTARSEKKKLVPFEGHDSGYIEPGKIWKALVFTGAFTVTSFTTASIMEYERLRSLGIDFLKKKFNWGKDIIVGKKTEVSPIRKEWDAFWSRLTPGEKLFLPLCSLNLIVFGLWRIPRLQPFMMQYFCSNPAARAVCWPMVLSTFSHYSAFHIFANMYVLHSFCYVAEQALGVEQFLGVYLAGGVISSFASYFYKAVVARPGLSLGASGAIMAILAYVCSKYPETRLSILFLPMYTFTAGAAIKVIMGIDIAGVLLGWRFFDHASHLGGAAFGLFWCFFGEQYLWSKRQYITRYWNEFRGPLK